MDQNPTLRAHVQVGAEEQVSGDAAVSGDTSQRRSGGSGRVTEGLASSPGHHGELQRNSRTSRTEAGEILALSEILFFWRRGTFSFHAHGMHGSRDWKVPRGHRSSKEDVWDAPLHT